MWSDRDILNGIHNGHINIDPFDEKAIQPASVDFRLGNIFYAFSFPAPGPAGVVIDPRVDNSYLMTRYRRNEYDLHPGEFVLGSTVERVTLSNRVVGRIEGKSSLGRLGLTVHCTAGFIDPGNTDLSLTLEMYNQTPHPIRLYAGMWICQLSFDWLDSQCDVPYGEKRGSRYMGDREPVPSRVHLKSGL